jgi:hypothetical protein
MSVRPPARLLAGSLLAGTLLAASLVAAACGASDTSFEDSRAAWDRVAAEHPDYLYARPHVSWTGAWHRTTVTVEAGVVTERHFEGGDVDPESGEPRVTETWTETGNELGTHPGAHPPVTMPQLYDECATILARDPVAGEVRFEVDERGLLATCTYRPLDCVDDCTEGIEIDLLFFF